MTVIQVNNDLCKGCGKCANYCIANNIEIVDHKAHIKSQECMHCGQCAAVCAAGAISVFGSVPAPLPAGHETLSDVLRTRRSVRKFKGALTNDQLRELLEITRYAPSAKNVRPIHFAVINRPRLTEVISTLAEAFAKNPNVPPFFAQYLEMQKTTDVIGRGVPHMVVAYATPDNAMWGNDDATIALTQFELYAVSKGYGTFWCGFMKALLSQDASMEAIGLKGFKCFGCMGVGIPDTAYVREAPHAPTDITFIE